MLSVREVILKDMQHTTKHGYSYNVHDTWDVPYISLAPGRCGNNFEITSKLIVQNSCLGTHSEIALR